jgi:hypothetical protein
MRRELRHWIEAGRNGLTVRLRAEPSPLDNQPKQQSLSHTPSIITTALD